MNEGHNQPNSQELAHIERTQEVLTNPATIAEEARVLIRDVSIEEMKYRAEYGLWGSRGWDRGNSAGPRPSGMGMGAWRVK